MPPLKRHLDEFTLFKLKKGELEPVERRMASSHVRGCPDCRGALRSVEALDAELRNLAESGELGRYLEVPEFDRRDPFRRRPPLQNRRRASRLGIAVELSDAGLEESERIVKAIEGGLSPSRVVKNVLLKKAEARFAIFYALQQYGGKIAEDPSRALEFARAVLESVRPPPAGGDRAAAEGLLSRSAVRAQAHSLAAQAHLWLREYAAARADLVIAYDAFAREGDETAVAMIELIESQRRSFLGEGRQALSLARRARATLEGRGLDDLVARACVAEGLALASLGRFAESIPAYREALPVFERFELWSNYVGALNSLATALYHLGRLDESRREFARVFRRFSREQHRSWLGYLRYGLGDILLAAGRYREAARSFNKASQVFEDCGLRASALSTAVVEAESWALGGSMDRANARLDWIAKAVKREKELDPSVKDAILKALSRAATDSASTTAFQKQLQSLLRSS